MIAADVATKIRRQVADQVVIEYVEADRLEISTPFTFLDGDHYGFSVLRDGSTGRWRVSDGGEIVAKAGNSGVDLLGKGRVERFRRTIEFYGISESGGELSLNVDNGEFGHAFFTFTQACLDLNRLAKMKADRPSRATKAVAASTSYDSIVSVVLSTLPGVNVATRWHDDKLDPHRIYTVDLYVPLTAVSLLIFIAETDIECLHSTISCQHYRQKNLPFEGIAIADESMGIAERNIIALGDAVNEKFAPNDADAFAAYLLAKAG